MKKLKALLLFLSAFVLTAFSVLGVRAGTSISAQIDVTLEQQESVSDDKIRYISTMTPVTDLASITKINIDLSLSKAGETTKTAEVTTYSVYDSVNGTNGKAAVTNTYYAVYTVTGLSDYAGWTLGAEFEYVYSDSTTETTNALSYDIPYTVFVTTGSGSFEASSSLEDCFTADSIENGNIFHAWNWSMSVIEENLDAIKAAGFTAVQTSPMQPQKDYYAGNTAKDAWWKLYQPLGFCIAPDSCQNQIGTKSNLISMINAAHAKGIKVIVDVVANHLAGGKNNLEATVQPYEPTIYGSNGTVSGGALLHSTTGTGATDSNNVTNGNIGLPDLDTSNSIVQQRVLSLLKEYIDCGVDGFRFDAAKHIETDNSGEPCGSSQFWPTVINGAKSYAASKGKDAPYCYGEILNTVGNNRSYDWYTPYMDVIANKCGNNLRSSFVSNTAAAQSSYTPTSLDGEDVVAWAESHDTYANDEKESVYTSISNINKTYAIMGARKGAKCLYLARPTDTAGYEAWAGCTTVLGAKGSDAFSWTQVEAVNKFRNYWGTADEYLSNDSNFAMVARYNGTSESGLVLVNAGSGTSVSNVTVPSVMLDGTYTDYVTNSTFTISGGKVSGTMSDCGIAVLYSGTGTGSCSIADDADDTFYSSSLTATYTIKNAVSATLTVAGKNYDITSGATVTLGSDLAVGDSMTVEITAIDASSVPHTESFTYTRIAAPTVYTITFTKPDDWGSTVYAYMWNGTSNNAAWPGEAMTLSGSSYTTSYNSFNVYDHIIFSDGTNKSIDLDLDQTDATYAPQAVTKAHFKNTAGWSTVYAYMWNGTSNNATWPGTALSKDSTGYYAVDYTSTYDKIIFNNGSSQTGNLSFSPYIALYDSDDSCCYNIVKNTCSVHTWDAGVITTPATCEADGVKTYTCSVCGATKTEAIAAIGHDYDYSVEPTWTWTGYDAAVAKFVCKNDATHKTSVNATITSETVGTTTTYTASVTVGGYNYQTTKVKDGSHTHTYTHYDAVAATCSTTGNYEYYYCADCDTYFDADKNETTLAALTIAATGHTVAAGVYSAATGVTCSSCGETVTYDVATTTIYYLVNSTWKDDWDTRVNIHYWKDGSSTTWPGEQMTSIGTVSYNGTTYTIYSYTFTSGSLSDYTGVIFDSGTNGTAKTNDLAVQAGANCYFNNYDTNYETTQFIYIP